MLYSYQFPAMAYGLWTSSRCLSEGFNLGESGHTGKRSCPDSLDSRVVSDLAVLHELIITKGRVFPQFSGLSSHCQIQNRLRTDAQKEAQVPTL